MAECGFYDFHAVARDRMVQFTGVGPSWLWAPATEAGLLYVRLRYGLPLGAASPADGLRRSNVPVLLIHGTADRNIPPAHSERLLALHRPRVELWRAPGAGHVSALSTNPDDFRVRILGWFQVRNAADPGPKS